MKSLALPVKPIPAALQTRIVQLTFAKDYIERGLAILQQCGDAHAFDAETCVMSIRNTITSMQTFPEDYTANYSNTGFLNDNGGSNV